MSEEAERAEAQHQRAIASLEAASKIAVELIAANPGLHPITAHVMADDILSAQRATEMVNDGRPASEVYVFVGSYARWDWIVTMVAAGNLSDDWLMENIADLWTGADPDDTSVANLAVWKRAFHRNGGTIRDGRPLPKAGEGGFIKVFRGGSPFTVRNGFSWTTDPKIAGKFAATNGGRAVVQGGVVITGLVRPRDVLAYLTGRGESEVIVDPRLVELVHPTGEGR